MKKLPFIFLTLFICSLAFAAPIQERKIDPIALRELTELFDISKDQDLVAETQKKWLRGNRELWELGEIPEDQKSFVLDWAEEQGLFSALSPLYGVYDKGVILGATVGTMKKRLLFLANLWNQGVRFKEIVWLTGERPLSPQVEEEYLDLAQTEADGARLVWAETELPKAMKSLPVIFVSSPMKEVNGQLKRPTTGDTIHKWIEESQPSKCSALFVSNQPYCGYQFAVLKTLLPDHIEFDVVGNPIDKEKCSAAKTLDTLARWIYQESKCRN